MKSCTQCRQENRDDARFCHQCGAPFAPETRAAAIEPEQVAPQTDTELLKAFIGPNADRYLETFKKFSGPNGPQFALTWHWPAFVFEPFLWFLYRKMYVYALIYAIGPAMAFYITQDLSADIVWRVIAGEAPTTFIFGMPRSSSPKSKTSGAPAEKPASRC